MEAKRFCSLRFLASYWPYPHL
ncbi:hypothetical protein CTAM01_00442 [Colletotrichum tamarilloi]|uniref:Uncharacterized protein n=1 Tax=Colletotrichum tamarilloi TaxID=1209934 RepID=A0ABQ9RVU9_9PEZI|nr:hypothetical protein CTAM01_00442 [Colletotrichum tamarilloi]